MREFVSVILPLKLAWEPCYSIVDEQVSPGVRVMVAFSGKEYVGVVHRTGVEPNCDPSKVRRIKSVESGLEAVSEEEIRFWEFLSEYYLCSIGEVYKQAFPLLKLNSEISALNNRRRAEERQENTRRKILSSLESRVRRLEEREERKKNELDKRLALESSGGSRVKRGGAEALKRELEELSGEISSARAALDAFCRKMSSPVNDASPDDNLPAVREKTKPGKAEIVLSSDRLGTYIGRVRETLDKGLDTLILVPEIAAGEILQERLSTVFGDELLLFTSHTSPALRRKAAEALRGNGGPYVIVGTRASLFLPFHNLGLVIIDNEQDSSYKQSDTSPRFNARDAAMMLARIHGAQVILGSACPSLETLSNSLSGKYGPLPVFRPDFSGRVLIDIAAERRKNGMAGCFSRKLVEMVKSAGGPVAFIYGWEKPAELQTAIDELFPAMETILLSFPEARRTSLSSFALVAVLQADFLTGRDDFRADERAFQTLSVIGDSVSGRFVVQTAKPGHQIFSMTDPGMLLGERKDFGLPPFSRMVDVRISDTSIPRLELIASRIRRLMSPSMELPSDGGITFRFLLTPGADLPLRKQAIKDAVLQVENELHCQGHICLDVDPT